MRWLSISVAVQNPTATVNAVGYRTGLVELGFGGARLGGDDGWGYNHSDEGEGDQEVMHWGGLLGLSSSELFHSLIIGPIKKILNPT